MKTVFAILGVIFVLAGNLIHNRRRAILSYMSLRDMIASDPEGFKAFSRTIGEGEYDQDNIFVPKKAYAYLITLSGRKAEVVSLNNSFCKTCLPEQYHKLNSKMKDNTHYTYSLDTYAVYCKIEHEGKESILKMEHSSPFQLHHRYSGHNSGKR